MDSELLEDKSTVLGVVCTDEEGLCLEGMREKKRESRLVNLSFFVDSLADGKVNKKAARLVSSLTKCLGQIEPENKDLPIIVLDKRDKT